MSPTSVRLFAESVFITRTDGLRCEHDEVLAPLVAIRSADREVDRRARAILERLGAIDLTCIDEVALPPDCEADYVPHANPFTVKHDIPDIVAWI